LFSHAENVELHRWAAKVVIKIFGGMPESQSLTVPVFNSNRWRWIGLGAGKLMDLDYRLKWTFS